MTPARWTGHLLLWSGFLSGAYVAVAQLENAAHKWLTINWPLYALALAVGVVGVVLLRATQRQLAVHVDKLDADIQILEASVHNLLAELARLRHDAPQTAVFQVHRMIDSRLLDHISRFVDSRQTLIHTFGLQAYADLMTDFSLAERNLNRAWSASADGYVDEVWASLGRAEQRLQAVAVKLKECQQRVLSRRT